MSASASHAGSDPESVFGVSDMAVVGVVGGVIAPGLGAEILVAAFGTGASDGGAAPHARLWICDLIVPCSSHTFPIVLSVSGKSASMSGVDPTLGAVAVTFPMVGNAVASFSRTTLLERMCRSGPDGVPHDTTTIRLQYSISGSGLGIANTSSAYAASASGWVGDYRVVTSVMEPYPVHVARLMDTSVTEQDTVEPCPPS